LRVCGLLGHRRDRFAEGVFLIRALRETAV